jgi:hypothetical protein
MKQEAQSGAGSLIAQSQSDILQPDDVGPTGPSTSLLSCPVCLVGGFTSEASVNAQSAAC